MDRFQNMKSLELPQYLQHVIMISYRIKSNFGGIWSLSPRLSASVADHRRRKRLSRFWKRRPGGLKEDMKLVCSGLTTKLFQIIMFLPIRNFAHWSGGLRRIQISRNDMKPPLKLIWEMNTSDALR